MNHALRVAQSYDPRQHFRVMKEPPVLYRMGGGPI
jgi:hypothetical protein